jgi:preprotein translocase subunit SecE
VKTAGQLASEFEVGAAMAEPQLGINSREGDAAMAADESQVQTHSGKPVDLVGRVRHFIHEVVLEMKKVSWPTRTEVINTTIVVIVAVFFFAFFLFTVDIVLAWLIQGIEAGAAKLFG